MKSKPHKVDWWEDEAYKYILDDVRHKIPLSLDKINNARHDLVLNAEKERPSEGCVRHNNTIIENQLAIIGQRFARWKKQLSDKKELYRWKQIPGAKRLANINWEATLPSPISQWQDRIPAFPLNVSDSKGGSSSSDSKTTTVDHRATGFDAAIRSDTKPPSFIDRRAALAEKWIDLTEKLMTRHQETSSSSFSDSKTTTDDHRTIGFDAEIRRGTNVPSSTDTRATHAQKWMTGPEADDYFGDFNVKKNGQSQAAVRQSPAPEDKRPSARHVPAANAPANPITKRGRSSHTGTNAREEKGGFSGVETGAHKRPRIISQQPPPRYQDFILTRSPAGQHYGTSTWKHAHSAPIKTSVQEEDLSEDYQAGIEVGPGKYNVSQPPQAFGTPVQRPRTGRTYDISMSTSPSVRAAKVRRVLSKRSPNVQAYPGRGLVKDDGRRGHAQPDTFSKVTVRHRQDGQSKTSPAKATRDSEAKIPIIRKVPRIPASGSPSDDSSSQPSDHFGQSYDRVQEELDDSIERSPSLGNEQVNLSHISDATDGHDHGSVDKTGTASAQASPVQNLDAAAKMLRTKMKELNRSKHLRVSGSQADRDQYNRLSFDLQQQSITVFYASPAGMMCSLCQTIFHSLNDLSVDRAAKHYTIRGSASSFLRHVLLGHVAFDVSIRCEEMLNILNYSPAFVSYLKKTAHGANVSHLQEMLQECELPPVTFLTKFTRY